MRFVLLLMLACPLLAQEKTKPPDRAQVMKWLMQLHGDPAKRKEAEEALLKLTPEQWLSAMRLKDLTLRFGEDRLHGLRVLIDPGGLREIIKGSWTGEGGKTTYSLKSLGKGRYKLTGTKTEGNKKTLSFADEGTMAELKQRHEFLKANLAIRVPWLMFGPHVFEASRSVRKMNLIKSLGIAVKGPSEDLAYHLYLPQGVGFVVVSVPPGSVAEKLGLEKFDVITKLDGKWLEKRRQLEVKTGTLEYVRRATTGRLKLE